MDLNQSLRDRHRLKNPPFLELRLSGEDGGVSSWLLERKLSVSSRDVRGVEYDALIGVAGTRDDGCVDVTGAGATGVDTGGKGAFPVPGRFVPLEDVRLIPEVVSAIDTLL